MPGSNLDPRESRETPKVAQTYAPGETAPGDSVSAEASSLLEKVLRQTLSQQPPAEPLTAEDEEALRAVARRYQGQDLVAQPITAELIEALLRDDLAAIAKAPQWRARITGQIAETLWEDPASHNRLQVLWDRLGRDEA
jgi:hypothetical protein